jgi:hypothetical protein
MPAGRLAEVVAGVGYQDGAADGLGWREKRGIAAPAPKGSLIFS